jgi:hypothetical protein
MKRLQIIWVLGLLAFLPVSCRSAERVVARPGVNVSIQMFYDELAPYGRWIYNPSFGQVWVPNVEPGFQPYATRGHWVMTQYGNTWVSDYAWGWAPFHYGRWYFDNMYGWIWVPGTEWGPAWVAWRSGGDYYGWAPLGPGMNINVSINIAPSYWTFVPRRYITSPMLYNYWVPRTRVVNIYNQTTIINNYYTTNNRTYVYGPRANEIERHTGNRVRVHQINHEPRPGRSVVQNGSVRMYRPEVASATKQHSAALRPHRGFGKRSGQPQCTGFVAAGIQPDEPVAGNGY